MKLQLQLQMIRFRISEAELAQLLAGKPVGNITALPNGDVFESMVNLVAVDVASLEAFPGRWHLLLPHAEVLAYVDRLPCRDSLEFNFPAKEGGTSLGVCFEVDVRDSARVRGAHRLKKLMDAT